MDLLSTLSLAMGASWASGLRLYAAVATLGLLGRFTPLELPGALAVVENPWVLGTALVLGLVEFVADKVSYVDTAWDAVHTFIRIPAGAVLAYGAFADFDPAVQAVALLVGGGLAAASHGTKAGTRVAVNASPEPFSNMAVSTAEDGLAVGTVALAAFVPVLAIALVLLAVGLALWFVPRLWRRVRGRRRTSRGPVGR